MNILENLEKLSAISGISGQEDAVREYIIGKIQGKCEHKVDALGNIIAFKKGANTPQNSIYMSAHMDEVGFIVTSISDEGLLRFDTVGGIDSRVVFGKNVLVGKNQVAGVIGGKPVHLLKSEERNTPAELDKLFIDIGAVDKDDAEKHVNIGDGVVFDSQFIKLGEHNIVGKAFDDRAGCAILIDLIETELDYDVTFGFTVQEEIGCVGGQTAAYGVNADIGVVVEATTASDIAGVDENKQVCKQGHGPVISFMDKGAVYDKKLFDLTMDTAKSNNIPCQAKLGVFGGNEARVIQTARSGASIVAVSLPTRYIHSGSNSLDIRDIASTRKLLQVLLKELAEVNL